MISFCLLNATLHSSKHQTSLLSLHWIEFSLRGQKVKSFTQGRGQQIGGLFTCLHHFWQAHKCTNKNQNNQKSDCGGLVLLASWQESNTHRQALTLQPQTDGSWGWVHNAIWFHTSDENTSAHRCCEKWEKRRRMRSHDMTRGKKGSQQGEKERENNSFCCNVQNLRFLQAVLPQPCHHWQMPNHLFCLFPSQGSDWIFNWADQGYSDTLSDAKKPLKMQREKRWDLLHTLSAFFFT